MLIINADNMTPNQSIKEASTKIPTKVPNIIYKKYFIDYALSLFYLKDL